MRHIPLGLLPTIAIFALVGCTNSPPPPEPPPLVKDPRLTRLVAAAAEVVDAIRADTLAPAEDDRSLAGMIGKTIRRREGLAEAIAKTKEGSPHVAGAFRILRAVLQTRAKHGNHFLDTAVLIRVDDRWHVAGMSLMVFKDPTEIEREGPPYQGEDIDEIAELIARRRKLPPGLPLKPLDQVDRLLLEPEFAPPEDWEGKILQVRECIYATVVLPGELANPVERGCLYFSQRRKKNFVKTEGPWQSEGNQIYPELAMSPLWGPVLSAEGELLPEDEVAKAIRQLFLTGDIEAACQVLTKSPRGTAVVPYLNAARLVAIGAPDDNRGPRIVQLAKDLDAYTPEVFADFPRDWE